MAAPGMSASGGNADGTLHLVITNVPYLARGKQEQCPQAVCTAATSGGEGRFGHLIRLSHLRLASQARRAGRGDAAELAIPQELPKTPRDMLKHGTWNLVARLGPGAFETIGGEIVKRRVERAVCEQAGATLTDGWYRRLYGAGPEIASTVRESGVFAWYSRTWTDPRRPAQWVSGSRYRDTSTTPVEQS